MTDEVLIVGDIEQLVIRDDVVEILTTEVTEQLIEEGGDGSLVEHTETLNLLEQGIQGPPGPAAFPSSLADNVLTRAADQGFYVPPQMVWTGLNGW